MSRDPKTIAGELLSAASLQAMTLDDVWALAEAYLDMDMIFEHVRLADRQQAEMDADRERNE